ncbi:MAG TPA: hypothetical protein VFU14_07840 [Acidimicrobiales bacterium]|nr:hypothetical protein [Acidimicrobiales bacterium]
MPEHGRIARILGASAAALLAALLAAPAASGQTDEVPPPTSPDDVAPPGDDAGGRWAGSGLHAPFDVDGTTLRQETFTVAGEFHYERMGPADQIAQATIQVVDDPSDDFTPGEACLLPPPVVVPGTGEDTDGQFTTADLRFAVDVEVPCNGRYLVQAEARLNDPQRPPFTLERSFVLAALPAAVTEVGAKVRDDERKAVVTFTPLTADQLDPDATGYVVERSGPAVAGEGRFDDVGTLGLDDEPRLVDDLAAQEAGTYTYRVRAVRAGADGDVRSSIIDTATAAIELEGDPTSPTTTADSQVNTRGGSIRVPSRATSTRRRSTTARQGPPTTLDTGFEESLDYGDGELGQELADEPVAGGQSVVRDEEDTVDLAVPAAGALVMLGWAGHIVYLNRLAKQL